MFCRECGKATRPLAGALHRQCTSCGAMDWVNPAPAVGLAVVQDGHVLLSRRGHDPKRGQWDLIGGFMEAGETPEQALEREVLEETGCAVANVRMVEVQPGEYGGRPTLNFLARGELLGTPRPQDDSVELRFHPLDRLPMMAWPHEQAFLSGLK
jgi:NAD+ diphosphatase